jgi:hypothetical protein
MAELLCVSTDVADSLRQVQTKLKALMSEEAVLISIETLAGVEGAQITPFFLTRLAELIKNEKVHLVLVRGSTDMVELLDAAGYPITMLTIEPDSGEYLVSFDPQMYVPAVTPPVALGTLH